MKTASASTTPTPLPPAHDRAQSSAKRFWGGVALVLLAEAVAIIAFYGLEWAWLRQLHVLWLQTTLPALGCTVQTAGTLLTVNGQHFQIDPDCTYVDLVVCSLPLLWRTSRSWTANLGVMGAYAAAVLVVNLARVLYGVYAYANGVSLFWAHDLMDYVLWYPTMAIVALLWMRSLRPGSAGRESALTEQSPICNPQSAIETEATA